MSLRYRGSIMWATLPTVTGAQSTPGAWTLTQQMQYQAAGTWPQQLPATWATSGVISSGYNFTPDTSFKTLQDSSGNSYFLSGCAANNPYIAKFNPDGTKAWENAYGLYVSGSVSSAYFHDGVFDSSGNLILAFNNKIGSNWTVGLAKISPSGSVISIKSYDFGSGGAYIAALSGGCIAMDAAGDVYLVGLAVISSQYRGFVLKASGSTLNLSWCTGTYGYTGTNQGDYAYGVAVTPDGNSVYVSGYAQGSSSGTRFAYISRLTTNTGSLLNSYQMSISGQGSYSSGPIAIDASGNIYITGRTTSNNYFFGKLDSSLTPQWGFSSASASNNLNPNLGVSVGADGDIYFFSWGGSTLSSVPGAARQWSTLLARVTPAGSLVYTRNTSSYFSVSIPSSGEKVVYLSYADVSSSRTQYQRMPANGGGTSLYSNAASNFYYNYIDGPSLTTATLSISSASQLSATLSPSTYTYSGVAPSAVGSTYTLTSFTSPRIPGSALYTIPGTYSWIAPAGVTSVSVLAIGGGGGGAGYPGAGGGGGGGLGYSNSQSVTPGTAYTVVVGAGGTGSLSSTSGTAGVTSYFISAATVAGNGGGAGINSGSGGAGGTRVGAGGGSGGAGGNGGAGAGAGGGGAGGYAGNGGAGGGGSTSSGTTNGIAGSGGGGGGGFGSGYQTFTYGCGTVEQNYPPGQSGGSVGIAGQGANGALNGGIGSPSNPLSFGAGGNGGGIYQTFYPCCGGVNTTYASGADGRNGAVRIVWGAGRSFPSTSVGAP